jgi:hypothetical protein
MIDDNVSVSSSNTTMFTSKEQWIEHLKKMPTDPYHPNSKTRLQDNILYSCNKSKGHYDIMQLKYHNDSEQEIIGNEIHISRELNGTQALNAIHTSDYAPIVIANYAWSLDGPLFDWDEIWQNIAKIQPVSEAEVIAYLIQSNFRNSLGSDLWIS